MPVQLARLGFQRLWNPELIVAAVVIAVLYLYAAGRLRAKGLAPPTTGQRIYFLTGIVLLYLAVGSPLDALSDEFLFSAHMLEHMLIGLFVPPFLLLGLPDGFWRVVFRNRAVLGVTRFLTKPLIAILLFNIAFSVYHFPYLYELGLYNEGWHFVEHAVLFVTGMIMWWPIIAPSQQLPQMSAPGRLIYLFLDTILMTPVFAIVLFAAKPLYTFYLHVPHLFGLSPLADQQLGAIVMKVSALIAYGTAAAIVFVGWIRREAMRERAGAFTVYGPFSPDPVRTVRTEFQSDAILQRELS